MDSVYTTIYNGKVVNMKDFPQFMNNEKIISKALSKTQKTLMVIFLKVKMVVKWLLGHIILIKSPKSINTNLTSTWFVLTDNIS